MISDERLDGLDLGVPLRTKTPPTEPPTHLFDYIDPRAEVPMPVMDRYYALLRMNLVTARTESTNRAFMDLIKAMTITPSPADRHQKRGSLDTTIADVADAGALVLANTLLADPKPLELEVTLGNQDRPVLTSTLRTIRTMFGGNFYSHLPETPNRFLAHQFGLTLKFERKPNEDNDGFRDTVTFSPLRGYGPLAHLRRRS
jgi:hypothetical protein